MPELLLYEYAVIRIVPRVEREEFINAGVIVFSKSIGFLSCRIQLHTAKLQSIYADADIEFIRDNLDAFKNIALGKECKNNIARLDAAARFRWLTATRSTIIQCSRVHPGLCLSPKETIDILFDKLVQ